MLEKMSNHSPLSYGVVIVAAGRGERAGSPEEGPKQYRPIGGLPVISHTLNVFMTWGPVKRIVAVIHPEDEHLFADALGKAVASGPQVDAVHGGATRQQSVLAGLEALAGTGVTHVLIQDAVRPFTSHAILERVGTAFAGGAGAVLPAIAVADTLKRRSDSGHVAETVSRTGLYGAQTPQSFRFDLILDAHRTAAAAGLRDFTDDAAIAEWAGTPVLLVEGSVDNVKLTLKRDITMADEKLDRNMLPDVRTGNGYDVHQLVEGDGVILCGVHIPHSHKLSGHSDADVALHALTDALLATCGAGDIGDHFPPSDLSLIHI